MKETRFKQTEIGLVPEEWKVVRLGEIGEPKMCKRIMKWQTSEVDDIPFYKIGTFGNTPDAFISRELFEDYKSRYSYPRKGDLLISAAGTIGRVVVYNGEDAYYQDSNIVWIDNREEKALNAFLHYAYSNVEWETNTGTIPRLYNDNLKSIHIPLPPHAEQERIAGALSGVDGLLSSLSRLIEKKRALRTAAMQRLLTAKTRLPGFNEPWKEVRLGEVCKVGKGKGYSKDNLRKVGTPVVLYGRLYTKYETLIKDIDTFVTPYPNSIYSKGGEVVIPGSGETAEDIARASVIVSPNVIIGGDLNILYPSKSVSSAYVALCLTHNKEVNSSLANKAQGKTVVHLHGDEIANTVFSLPTLPEQRAIASALSEMDRELSALCAKRSKIEALRAGMMQDLLSGRIRLK